MVTLALLLCAAAGTAPAEPAASRSLIEADWMLQDGASAPTAAYIKTCEKRRAERLARLPQRFVFAKHYNMGGSHYAYTEGQFLGSINRLSLGLRF